MNSGGPLSSSVSQVRGVRFADDEARALLAGVLPTLDCPGDDFERVKQGITRTVYRGRAAGQDLYLKHFHPKMLLHRIARRLGVSHAMRELRFSRFLGDHGVPVPRALAAVCRGDTEWVATATVESAEQGDRWHEEQLARDAAGRRAIRAATVELARVIAAMHDAGVLHGDLHCGNVLVRTDTPEPKLVLTDLHRVRRCRWLSRRARAANLAQLLHDRRDLTTRTERLRFLKHYLAASRVGGAVRGWRILIEERARRHSARQYAKRDRRITGTNRYFTRLRLGDGWRGHAMLASKYALGGSRAAAMAFRADDWRAVLADPEALLTGPDVTVVKDSPTSLVVRRRIEVGGQEIDVHIKRTRRKRPWKILLDCLRRARSIRAFRLGHELLNRRVATALPLVALEQRRGAFLLDSLLIAETVEGAPLSTFLDKHLQPGGGDDRPLGPAEQRSLAQAVLWQLGRLVQRLHDHSYAHRDLKAPNLLVRWDRRGDEPPSPEIVLVDLDGLRRMWHLSAKRRFQGLMRLNVSLLKCPVVTHAGRLRMLQGYIRRPGLGRVNFKPYWRVLADWSGRKLTQQIRSRRKRQKAVRRPQA